MQVYFVCCRLFGYGIGIHLLQSEDPESMPKKTEINPKDNHISFQVIIFLIKKVHIDSFEFFWDLNFLVFEYDLIIFVFGAYLKFILFASNVF